MLLVNKGVAHPWVCDLMGHMPTRHYMVLFDDASYHFLFQVFGWSGNSDTRSGYGWVDVRHEIEYLAEVSTGDILEIRAGVSKIGGKSITVRYEMHNQVRNELAATLQCTCVLFDLAARKATPLTDDMRAAAGRHLLPPAEGV